MTNQKIKWHFHLLDAFLIFVPVSIAGYFLHFGALPSFLMIGAALIGLAHLMAESTSIIANRVSSTISALINATFGNAVELFIAIFSLRAGLLLLGHCFYHRFHYPQCFTPNRPVDAGRWNQIQRTKV